MNQPAAATSESSFLAGPDVEEVRDALVQGLDNAHVVRLLISRADDGTYDVQGDWRHLRDPRWSELGAAPLRRHLLHPCATALASCPEKGDAALWSVAQVLEGILHGLARDNRLCALTRCEV